MTENAFIDPTKEAKKNFSKIGLGLLIFTVISNVVAVILVEVLELFVSSSWISRYAIIISIVISAVSMYGIALPLLMPLWGKMPVSKPLKNEFTLGNFLMFFCISIALSYIGSIISTTLQIFFETTLGTTFSEDSIDIISRMRWYEAILPVVVILPFFEELLFRKLIIDRTRMYGEKLSIIFAALMFAFFHTSVDQFFYTFGAGLLFGYLYLRTGKLMHCWLLHGLFNLFGAILPLFIMEHADYEAVFGTLEIEDPVLLYEAVEEHLISFILIGGQSFMMLAFTIIGGVFAERMIRNARFSKTELELPKDSEATTAFMNVGTVLFVALSVLLILLSAK